MDDYSYKYGMPRSEVHLARYGVTAVPPRRGMGGATIGDGIPVVPILAVAGAIGLAALIYWYSKR